MAPLGVPKDPRVHETSQGRSLQSTWVDPTKAEKMELVGYLIERTELYLELFRTKARVRDFSKDFTPKL